MLAGTTSAISRSTRSASVSASGCSPGEITPYQGVVSCPLRRIRRTGMRAPRRTYTESAAPSVSGTVVKCQPGRGGEAGCTMQINHFTLTT